MAKAKKSAAPAKAAPTTTSKRAGYKRKSGKPRINQLMAQLEKQARKAQKRAQYDKTCSWAQPTAK